MKLVLIAGMGSFIGGALRYLISLMMSSKSEGFPVGTLAVNIFGCFVIGIVLGFADKEAISQDWKIFLTTGILGGFTTFSAFSYETVALLREGDFWNALAYVAASVVGGLIVTYLGVSLVR